MECGGAHSVESFAAARAADANGRAGDWVACDKGLRVQPEAGALVLHYNQPAAGHLDGAVDFKAFNAVCDVQACRGIDLPAGCDPVPGARRTQTGGPLVSEACLEIS